jgi:NO-binding membrane sensor protein with MHYT domain
LTGITLFGRGWIEPSLAYLMSVIGVLLGLMLYRQALTAAGLRRVRLVTYATVALAGVAIWLGNVVRTLSVTMPASVVRFDLSLLLASLGVAVAFVGCGITVAVLNQGLWWRSPVAIITIATGLIGSQYTTIAAVQVPGSSTLDLSRIGLALGLSVTTAIAAILLSKGARSLRSAMFAAAVLAANVAAVHYLELSAIRVAPMASPPGLTGVNSISLLGPAVLIGASVIAMLAFFTFGSSTWRDLLSIFEADQFEEIEAWLIAEVSQRASEVAAMPAAPRAPSSGQLWRRAPGPRPTPGITPAWLHMPVWGPPDEEDTVVRMAPAQNTRRSMRRQRADESKPVAQTPGTAGSVTSEPFDGIVNPAREVEVIARDELPIRYPPANSGQSYTNTGPSTRRGGSALRPEGHRNRAPAWKPTNVPTSEHNTTSH